MELHNRNICVNVLSPGPIDTEMISSNYYEKLNLFSVLQLSDVALNNMIIVSSMQHYSALDGLANSWYPVNFGGGTVVNNYLMHLCFGIGQEYIVG